MYILATSSFWSAYFYFHIIYEINPYKRATCGRMYGKYMYRAVSPPPPLPPRLQLLRIDGEGMIDDVIMHGTWRHLWQKKPPKRCCWNCNIGPNWFTITFIAYITTAHVKFHCQKVESKRNGKLRQLSGRFPTLIWRPRETVQNLESPALSGRVGSLDVALPPFI